MSSRRLVLAGLICSFATVAAPASAKAPALGPGQVWNLRDQRYPAAQVVIGRLEKLGDVSVVHVSVLQVLAGGQESGQVLTFGHMPFTEEAVRRSIGSQIRDGLGAHPGFDAGYAEWRSARGGVFTITIPEALAVAMQAMMSAPSEANEAI